MSANTSIDHTHADAGEPPVRTAGERTTGMSESMRGGLVVLAGGTLLVGIAFAAMVMLTSPDGWVMKAANQAVTTAQQGTLASYDIAAD